MTQPLQDKVVLITGGAKRVGAAICRLLHAGGARLMIHYRHSADEARALHFHLNRLWNTLPHEILPGCVKYIQHLQGLPLYHPRAPMVGPEEGLRARIAQVLAPVLAA